MSIKKVLVIEDELSLRLEISEVLTFENFIVIQADNGLEGERLAIKEKPDLILCDIMMPGINGMELLTRLRKKPETMRIPFIFMSALSERKHLRTGMELGADDYISKPFTIKEVLSAIKTRLNKSEMYYRFLEQEINKVTKEIENRLAGFSSNQIIAATVINPTHSRQDAPEVETKESILEAMKSIDSNNRLNNLKNLVDQELLQSRVSGDSEEILIKLRNEIKSKSNLINNWSVFQMRFNQAYPGFIEKLSANCPKLTAQEITLASALFINLNTIQLAGLLNITPGSIRKYKSRLKKKLNLDKKDSLGSFLRKQSNE